MLNLLPPSKKHTIEESQAYRFIQRCCMIVISCAIVLSAVMIVSRLITKFVLTTAQTRSTSTVNTPDQATISKQLNDITVLSTAINAIQKNFHQPVPVLLQMINQLPDGITFSTLHLNYATANIQVTGVADSREQLLQLSQMVNNQPAWTKVKFPLQDFTQKTNIPFEFEVTLTTPQ